MKNGDSMGLTVTDEDERLVDQRMVRKRVESFERRADGLKHGDLLCSG